MYNAAFLHGIGWRYQQHSFYIPIVSYETYLFTQRQLFTIYLDMPHWIAIKYVLKSPSICNIIL